MIAFGHSSTGVIVGVGAVAVAQSGASPSLVWLLPATVAIGVASHYLCDAIPHGHYHFSSTHPTTKQLALFALDFFGVVILFGVIALHKFGLGAGLWLIAAGVLGAQLPDIYEAFVDLRILPTNKFSEAHRHWHWAILHWHHLRGPRLTKDTRALGWWDIWQVGVFGLALWLLVRVPSR